MFGKGKTGALKDMSPGLGGTYIYTGDSYRYTGSTPRKKALGILWAVFGAAGVCLSVAGLIPAPGMQGGWYVILPYVVSLMSGAAQLWSLGRLATGGESLRRYVYETAHLRLPRLSILTAVLCGVSLIGEGIALLREGVQGNGIWAAAFLILMALAGILSLLGRRLCALLSWELIEKDSPSGPSPDPDR